MNIVFDFGNVLFTWDPVALVNDHFPAAERSQWLVGRVQGLASIASARHDQVGDMLESVSVLGRVDHIRRQLDGYPQQEA